MACSISILSVDPLPGGGSVTNAVRVSGTLAGDCPPIHLSAGSFDVVVEVSCGGAPVTAPTRSSGGQWQVDVPIVCNCGGPITVRAACAADPACSDTRTVPFECPQNGNCPTGSITVAVGDCNADGTRNVTLTATLTNVPAGTVVQWDHGDGSFAGSAFPVGAPGPLPPHPHGYAPPGPYTASLLVIIPSGCPPLTVAVTGLAPCAIDCPAVEITDPVIGNCNPDGTRTVMLDATVTGGTPQVYHWEFGDGAVQNLIPPSGPAVSHNYPAPGGGLVPYTASLTVTGLDPTCIDTDTRVVDVPGCGAPCPEISGLTASVGACVGGKRTVTFTATIAGAGVTEYGWDFGDGSSYTISGGPSTTHAYQAPASGSQNFIATLTIKGPPGCPQDSESVPVSVSACGGGGGGLCGLLLPAIIVLAAIAAALTILALALPACVSVPVPAWLWWVIGGIWLAIALLLAAAWILCRLGICPCPEKCDLAAVPWVILLAAFLVALYLSTCCTGLWWLLVVALGAGFAAAFGAWYARCKPDRCEVYGLLALTIVTIAATILSYIALVPPIAACGSQWVAAAVAAFGALFTGLLWKCQVTSGNTDLPADPSP